MWKVNLEPRELNQLTPQVKRLGFELKNVEAEIH
jgi:hypothetical protein